MRQNQKRTKKVLSILTAGAVILTTLSSPAGKIQSKAETTYGIGNPTIQKDVLVSGEETDSSEGLHNPIVKTDVLAWDTITFGNYWQEDTNEDYETNKEDDKLPIRWRVLSVEGDDAFLMADQAIESLPFDEEGSAVTWEKCSLRKWLNEEFIKEAFTEEEQAAIKETTVVNKGNEEYNTDAGADTQDKIYLLSIDEAADTKYGFEESDKAPFHRTSPAREAAQTMYSSEAHNAFYWWLRSPGDENCVSCVGTAGDGDSHGITPENYGAVRPVLHLDLSAPVWEKAEKLEIQGQMQTVWDCVEFGNYWQESTTETASAEKQPIKWRVLSVDGNDAFLLADEGLDNKPYHGEITDTSWEKCDLRAWLNDTFMKDAFTEEEQKAIKITTVSNSNKDNPDAAIESDGGADTQDRIYLLSAAEVANTAYGFDNRFYMSRTREAKATAYAYDQGAFASWIEEIDKNGKWWLRSPGFDTNDAAYVSEYGDGTYYGTNVTEDSFMVRPVIHLDLTSDLWKKVERVSSETPKTPEETPTPTPTAPTAPTAMPTTTPTVLPTPTPATTQLPPTPTPAATQLPPTPTPAATQVPPTVLPTQPPVTQAPATPTPEAAQTPSVQPEEKPVIQPSDSSQPAAEKAMTVSIQSVKNKKGRKAVVTWKKVDGAKSYQIQYAPDKKFKKKSKKVSAKKTTVTIKNLQKKKTYFIRVRACKTVKGSKVYGKWSKSSNVKIKK